MKQPAYTEFSNPEMVQILGYDDNDGNSNDAMEPFISRDGNYLFFNNSNSAPTTSLFWATRVDDVTFQYQGEIGGEVNSSGPLDAVPSMDMNGNFYFITNRSYAVDLSTIYSGPFADVSDVASVTPVNPVAGVAAPKIGLVNFDSEISADGNTLYFTQGNYSNLAPGAPPSSTEMMVATNQGGTFVIDPHSAKIMKMINDKHLNYAPDTSADELEFFFTRTIPKPPTPQFGIYMATRSSTSKPFGKPKKIEAITGYAEAPFDFARQPFALLPLEEPERSIRNQSSHAHVETVVQVSESVGDVRLGGRRCWTAAKGSTPQFRPSCAQAGPCTGR